MRKLFIFLCLIVPVLSLHARAIQEDYKKADEKARVSYAFGMIIGSNLRSADLEFDYTAFAEGVKATIENSGMQFTEQEAVEIVEAALERAMERRTTENRLREEEFLARNRERSEVHVTQSGLQYEILVETDGEKPKSNSVVRVNYVGTFIDGSPFDSSNEEGGAFIPLELVISGWTEGLMLMSVGSEYRFYIPSELAYGSDGIQSIIPPYSTLIFTVELLEIINDDTNDFLSEPQSEWSDYDWTEELEQPEELEQIEELEDLEQPEELEQAEELEELEQPEELEQIEELEELEQPEELEQAEELEELEQPEELEQSEDLELSEQETQEED